MCILVHYTCQNCRGETGQRDYICHTDGERMDVPNRKTEFLSSCPDIRPMRVPIHYPGLQSPKFPCMNALCSGYKTKYNATKYQEQKARILAQLRDTDYKVTVEGNAYMKVGFMKKTRRTATEDKSKLNWWNLYTEDKLKEMTANGDSYEDIKTALHAITGLRYTTYRIIAKAASFDLHESLFGPHPAKPARKSLRKRI